MKNPFAVKTPETLTPEDIASLFVDVYSDFPRLLYPEHTFLHGARGTGKSMMLRYMEPLVQIAAGKVSRSSELKHFAVHMPIKRPTYAISEFNRLEGLAYDYLSEHILVCNALIQIFSCLNRISPTGSQLSGERQNDVLQECANIVGRAAGKEIIAKRVDDLSGALAESLRLANDYLKGLAFSSVPENYSGDLFSYSDALLPICRVLRRFDFCPSGPVYLMVDDADNLPQRMQEVLNTWVSYRTTDDLCLKISTQQRYKTWRTTAGALIERAHDFSEIDISSVYTSKMSSNYYDRVYQIVRRRLELARSAEVDPDIFFPDDPKQREDLNRIREEIKKEWKDGDGKSSRSSDDVSRYLTSQYMKELAQSKKTNLYSYAGFKSMVNISSGMVRYFLEPAARMVSDVAASQGEGPISSIPPDVQDRVIKKWSEEYVVDEFLMLADDERGRTGDAGLADKLGNLINGIGELFQAKLLSNDSERRFLSFALTSKPSGELEKVLKLGVEWGYFSVRSISKKEGVGRNHLYTLNRRLAPFFKLDPSGYAAHMSMTSEDLNIALSEPGVFVKKRLRTSLRASSDSLSGQTSLDI